MALYRVTWNGQDILDYTNERMVLLSPHHENELNMAGSLRFVVPTRQLYYDMFTPDSILISDVELYEDGELIWFGRPIQIRKDFFNQKEIYCEGALGFFNDSIQEKHIPYECGAHEFFRKVLANHNFQVDVSRRILPGNITVEDKPVYRDPNYEKTLDVLRGQCLETNGGYFFLRKENGTIYLDWLEDMPFTCNQTIEFAENMLNLSSTFDGSDYATCVMPLGAQDDMGDPINIYNINNNNHILESEMAKVYGRIVQVVQFSDIDDPYELMEEGKKALERIQYNSHIIECSAADLHARDGSKEMFRVGQMVHCHSEPHELEIDLPLSKIELDLDTAAKHITLGIIPKKTLTRISKQKEKQTESSGSGGTSGSDSSYTDDSGIDWEIIMPTEPGGPVTAIKMPTSIEIARAPNKTEYEPGEAIDFTGLLVNIRTGDQIWTNPPSYIDGRAPMSELSFNTKTAPSGEGVEGFSVVVTWKYKGKSFSTTLGLSVKTGGKTTKTFTSSGYTVTLTNCDPDTKVIFYLLYAMNQYWPDALIVSHGSQTGVEATSNKSMQTGSNYNVDGGPVNGLYWTNIDFNGQYATNELGWPVSTTMPPTQLIH